MIRHHSDEGGSWCTESPTPEVEWKVDKGELIAPNGQRFIIAGASHDTDLLCRRINESLAQARAPLVAALERAEQQFLAIAKHPWIYSDVSPSIEARACRTALTDTGEKRLPIQMDSP